MHTIRDDFNISYVHIHISLTGFISEIANKILLALERRIWEPTADAYLNYNRENASGWSSLNTFSNFKRNTSMLS